MEESTGSKSTAIEETASSQDKLERYDRWVAMWRDAVRVTPVAIGLVDLATVTFVDMSDSAAELLGTTPQRAPGLSYFSITERPDLAAQTFRLFRDRVLEGMKARRDFHRSDGSTVELQVVGWAIRSECGPDLGLWIAAEVIDGNYAADVAAPSNFNQTSAPALGGEISLDDRWSVVQVTTSAAGLMGRSPAQLLGRSLIDLAHPDDRAALLLGFARATTDAIAHVQFRLQLQDGSWRTIRAALARLDGDGSLPFTILSVSVIEAESHDAGRLAGQLRRIAAQIEAAGSLPPFMNRATAIGLPTTSELTGRQWEIASRLVGGQRVPTIAAELHLSPSTVRNYLSAIFARFSVHSQAELLALWRRHSEAEPGGSTQNH